MKAIDRNSQNPARPNASSQSAAILALSEPVAEATVALLSQTLDEELAGLEQRFMAFMTQRSLISGLRR
jgi:hypothetical protein